MDYLQFFKLSIFGIKTILLKQKKPILGTIILTDACNLNCKHCSVNNLTKIIYPYKDIKEEMINMFNEGIRILFFCGGETLLWKDENKIQKIWHYQMRKNYIQSTKLNNL